MHKIGKTQLNPVGLGSPCSHELVGNTLSGRLFGFIPAYSTHLANVDYLRLATPNELGIVYRLFNWMNFLPHRRSAHPVYLLQTKNHRRIVLRLAGDSHFRLRQAIGRQQEKKVYRVAA